jgi:hypothetical protein
VPDLDFDEPLGTFHGVTAWSNQDDTYFSGERAFQYGVYTGYKWQCVEYARRFMINVKGCQFGQVGPAYQIFGLTTVESVETGAEHPFVACENGKTTAKPRAGDTLVYPYHEKLMPVGHVAVISAVGDDWVGIAEQNVDSKSWGDKPYGRTVPLSQDAATGAWTMSETEPDMVDCAGWLYVEGVKDRPVLSGSGHNCHFGDVTALPKFVYEAKAAELTRYEIVKRAVVPKGDDAALVALQAERVALLPARDAAKHVDADGYWAARTAEWESLYIPNEEMGMGSIGGARWCFKLVGEALQCEVSALADARVASTYAVPVALVPALRKQLDGAFHNFMLGTLRMAYDFDRKHFTVVDAPYDSIAAFLDGTMQAAVADAAGYPNGWKMVTVDQDLKRFVTRFLLDKGADKASTVFFLDFGAAADLVAKGWLAPADVEAYTAERIAALYAVAKHEKFMAMKAQDVVNGDVKADDAPQYAIRVVDFFGDAVSVDGKLAVDGAVVQLSWKMAPWATVFAMAAAGSAKVAALLEAVAADVSLYPAVVQPLWAHVAQHSSMGAVVAAHAAAHDTLKHADDEPLSPFARAAGLPLAPVQQPAVPIRAKMGAPTAAADATDYFPVYQLTMCAKSRSCAAMGEVRRRHSDAPGPAGGRTVHPAVLTYLWGNTKLIADGDEDE